MSIDPERNYQPEQVEKDDGPGFISKLFRTSLNKQNQREDDELDR